MKIQDVKTWVVTAGVMVAKNPYEDIKHLNTYETGFNFHFEDMELWRNNPANHPATYAPNGIYDASLFDEPVWQSRETPNQEWKYTPDCDIELAKRCGYYLRQFMHYNPLDEREAIKTDKLYRPFWVEPAHLATLGYELISDENGYLKYQSSWKLKAMHRAGRTFAQLLGDGKRFIYFNCTYVPQDNLVFCCIREDADTRTVYNGVITEVSQLDLILKLVE
ncbi:hypothetical protein SNE25_21040 [Mucilaginibacter sabulilitoris]|uniref:Uncharacterized protein n=1 Tax=Mucilaginibacter sabulilitoris TaxID=1173583 RepID=A0ABZ0THD4_9SPHI|nr:hypothetical protein [Mucilaginibacter sabulilitoris]WPU91807.1 hypothetical protein SNE25_21040 [Mucilaginibacter sabulilitoris]